MYDYTRLSRDNPLRGACSPWQALTAEARHSPITPVQEEADEAPPAPEVILEVANKAPPSKLAAHGAESEAERPAL